MAAQLVLFDIPSRFPDNACWSFNTCKIRLALNYKGIDYRTEWLQYPDIEPRLRSVGLEGDPTQIKPYTCPAVQFPDGTYVMNGAKIIKRLEAEYPEPPLYLDSEATQTALDLVDKAFGPLAAVLMPQIPRKILQERCAEYFWRTREEILGRPLDDFEKLMGGEKAWEAAKSALEEAGAELSKTDGPFFLGDKVSYADLIYVSFLYFARIIDEDSYQRIVQHSEAFDRLYQACMPWMKPATY